jgi:hypothetical protein
VRRWRADLGADRRRGGGGPGKQRDRNREQQIDDACGPQCARQANPRDQDETAGENARSRAQAIGEIEHRDRFAACLRGPDQSGAHQRKRRPQQHRLRKNQRASDQELGGECQPPRAQGRQ